MSRERILELLASPIEENVTLALSLAESQEIDLTDFWADLTTIYQCHYGAIGEQYELIALWASDQLAWNGYALTRLPTELPMLRQLKRIQLNSNDFAHFPPELLQMPWLTHIMILHLSRHHYPLPPAIGNLRQLEALALGCISEIPEEIGELAALQGLMINNGSVATLPESIGKLQRLEMLDLSHNHLTALPESIGELSSLQHLQLYHNALATLPDLSSLKALEYLGLKNNRLTDIPDWIYELPNLQQVELAENPIPADKMKAFRLHFPNSEESI